MQRYQDVVLNSAGQPVSGASVLVRPTGSTSTSVIYATNVGATTATNPVNTDSNGRFFFYGTNARYDLVISGSYIQTTTVTDIMLEDVPLTNLAELTTASAARSNLGMGTATGAVLSAANNLSDLGSTATARINLGMGTSTGTVLHAANNLLDLVSTATARINLGMGTSTGTVLHAINNLLDLVSTATARINLGLGTSTGTVLHAVNNLSDLVSTATARINLGLGTSTGTVLHAANNLSDVAAPATARANLAAATTTASQSFTGGQRGAVVVLASTGQIIPDLSAANNFSLSMTVNTTLAAATNVVVGQEGRITITQNSTAKTLAYDSAFYKFAAGATATLSTNTAVGTIDVLRYYVMTTTSAECEMRNLVT